jgi:pimeloyl-ACP methyl ester carboxylesterase
MNPIRLSVQGRPVYAYTGGKAFDRERPCVVFVHGALNDHSVWNLLARWCAHHGHAVLAPDLPAHGGSSGPPLATVEAAADWVLALLDAAGAAKAAVAGHSLGSLIALEAAARAPERITRLVMLGTAVPMKVSEALLKTALEEPLRAIDMVNAWSFSTFGAKPSFPGPGMSLHGSNRALMRRMQAGAPGVNLFHHEFTMCDRYGNGPRSAEAVRCPATLILGDADQMTPPKAAREIAAALKARVVTVPAGHQMVAEAPDAVLAAVKAALGA